MSARQAQRKPLRRLWTGSVIDVDVHAVVPSIQALFPYMDSVWADRYRDAATFAPPPSAGQTYPPGLSASAAPRWIPADRRPAASDLSLLREHVLDAEQVEYAVLNCVYPVDGGHPDLSVALARAVNDWLIAEWLDLDQRLRASIVLPTRNDPAAIAAEIDRVGQHPGFVQALLPARSGRMYGKRLYWPVFEAIERNDLVAGIHWGGSNDNQPPSQSGWPSRYIEEYAAEVQVFESQLMSLIAEGVFSKFPTLRVSMLEIGFTWVPMWMWDMDRSLRASRREIPWVTSTPFEQVREHVRFSVAPFDAVSAEELARVVRWLGSDAMLLYASDYPHDHDDDLSVLLAAVPGESHAKLMSENARDWYRLPLPERRGG